MDLDRDVLNNLPLEILHCLFEAFDPDTLISLALANKSYLFLVSDWIDKPPTITASGVPHKASPGSQLKFLCGNLAKARTHQHGKEAAAVLRKWQTRHLKEQGKLEEKELAEWNVCNRCLRFKKQHKIRCTRCTGLTCESFICSFDCAIT